MMRMNSLELRKCTLSPQEVFLRFKEGLCIYAVEFCSVCTEDKTVHITGSFRYRVQIQGSLNLCNNFEYVFTGPFICLLLFQDFITRIY